MTLAVFPGTFDPITMGHVDVATRAARLFERVVMAVYDSGGRGRKEPLFSLEERVVLVRESLAHVPNIVVDSYTGLTVDYAVRVGARAIIRGLRAVSDFEYELGMANINYDLNREVETVCLMTTSPYSYIHSSLVREVARLGGDVRNLVPSQVFQALRNRLGQEPE